MARKNSIISLAVNNGVLEFTVAHGAGSFTLDPATLPVELRDRAMLHGLVQKVSDGAAIAKSELSGDATTDAATKFNAMVAIRDRLAAGEWSKRSGDGSGPVSGLILLAYMEWVRDMSAKKKVDAPSDEKMREVYSAKTRKEVLALRNVPAIAKIIDRIKSERGATAETIDTSELLGELGI